MERPARVREVEHIGGYRLRLTFSDGLVRELDFGGVLTSGILRSVASPRVFARVEVDPVAGTICWPGGVDLDPDVLHGDDVPEQGDGPRLVAQYRLRPTG